MRSTIIERRSAEWWKKKGALPISPGFMCNAVALLERKRPKRARRLEGKR